MDYKYIRQSFINYFGKLGYKHMPASPLAIDTSDEDLLFCNSGMYQFRNVFIESSKGILPADTKLMTIQPCIRLSGKHNDYTEIGTSTRHFTSFEMLGIFDFENTNRELVIHQCYQFILELGSIPNKDLTFTVHPDDSEGINILNKAGLNYIFDPSNVWYINNNNSSYGFCVEIYCRGIEIWNMVFPDSIINNGHMTPMGKTMLDVGGGLERLAAALDGTDDSYQTDYYKRGQGLLRWPLSDVESKILLDHSRSSILLIDAGILPGNKKHGYVLRKLLRNICRIEYSNRMIDFIEMITCIYNFATQEFGQKDGEVYIKILTSERDKLMIVARNTERELKKYKKTANYITYEQTLYLQDSFGAPNELIEQLAGTMGISIQKK
jgi:alanyl-tRNA synthetase